MDRKQGRAGGVTSQTLKAVLGIRGLIASGTVAAGERLSELALVEQLSLSRTPIRAALARLELEGLLDAIPSGGYAVRSFSDTDVADAIELRGVMEGMAARLAAERGGAPARILQIKDVLAELDMAVGASEEELDFETYIELNSRFHELLMLLAGSQIVEREISRVMAMPFASPNAFIAAQAEMNECRTTLLYAQQQHHAIVEAIEMREGMRAEALAREHARLARVNLHRVLEQPRLKSRVMGFSMVAG